LTKTRRPSIAAIAAALAAALATMLAAAPAGAQRAIDFTTTWSSNDVRSLPGFDTSHESWLE
jgi:hypothetical protein